MEAKKAAPAMKAAPTATVKKVVAKKDAAKNLDDLFEDGLKDIYWVEKALLKALPKMARNATSAQLKAGLEMHLGETMNQVSRLESVFETIDMKPKAEKCDAMVGIIEEGNGILEETELGAVRDAGIISACRKAEHYEIATYSTLASFAKQLGNKEAEKLLNETLGEEETANAKLDKLGTSSVNEKADK